MKSSLSTAVGSVLAVALLVVAGVPASSAGSTPTVKFGMDYDSINGQVNLGIRPDYAMFWAGVWNEKSGWSYLGSQADSAADRGVTPVVQWWYWGDDISRSCISHGCWSNLHDAHKNRDKWRADAYKLADTLHAGLKGRPGILVLESEFNKGDVATWDTFDGYLVEHMKIFRARAPELQIVLGFGNWGSDKWHIFDRAASAADMVGFQTMRGSTRDSASSYDNAVDAIKAATVKLKSTFGKTVLLHDLALSSYPSWSYEAHQERVVKELFARLDELSSAGLRGIVYRSLEDDPGMSAENYFGQAEKYWGLKKSDGRWKPAMNDWINGVKAERAGSTSPSPSPAPAPSDFQAFFEPKSLTNNHWVEVKASSSSPISKVEFKVNSGSWVSLPKTSWGHWAKSTHAPDGAKVQFRAWDNDGGSDLSLVYTWGSSASAFSASFTPKSKTNNWWIEVDVDANQPVRSVAVKVGGGSWTGLPKTSWGTYAKSLAVPDGTKVQFRATNLDWVQDYSTTYTWGWN